MSYIYLYKSLTVVSLLMPLSLFQPLSFPRLTILDVEGRSTPSPTAWDSITSSPTGYVTSISPQMKELQELFGEADRLFVVALM